MGADATLKLRTVSALPADDDDTLLPFSLPSLCKKKVTAAFDGGTIGSDGGVFLLADADRRIGLIDRLAALFPDTCDPAQVIHSMADPPFKVAFDRTSCRSPLANQTSLILHTAAYWLVRTVRDAIPKHEPRSCPWPAASSRPSGCGC